MIPSRLASSHALKQKQLATSQTLFHSFFKERLLKNEFETTRVFWPVPLATGRVEWEDCSGDTRVWKEPAHQDATSHRGLPEQHLRSVYGTLLVCE